MPTSSWDQKRKQIAQTMRGTVAPGGLSIGNAGATFRTNPMMGWGSQGAAAQAPIMPRGGPADPAGMSQIMQRMPGAPVQGVNGPQAPGLMGQAGGDPQMARMAQMPGFNYVPPPTGPAPVAAPGAAGAGVPWTMDDRMAFLRGRQTPANAMAYTQALGQGAYDYNRQGRGGGGYTTSGRGWGGGSSSARGGGFGF